MVTGADRTLEQRRAAFALEIVQRHTSPRSNEGAARRYATLAHSLPTMILQNGLGQALAYLLADAEGRPSPARDFYDALQDWLCGAPTEGRPERVYGQGDLLQAFMTGSRADYQRAQRHALALLAWVRKLADAYPPKSER